MKLSLRERCQVAVQAALGMSYLHDQDPAVIHFDLKPDNLLVDGEGDNMVIKVGGSVCAYMREGKNDATRVLYVSVCVCV